MVTMLRAEAVLAPGYVPPPDPGWWHTNDEGDLSDGDDDEFVIEVNGVCNGFPRVR